MIALAVKELREAKPGDRQDLMRIRYYLIATRSTMAQEASLFPEIQALLDFIEKELGS